MWGADVQFRFLTLTLDVCRSQLHTAIALPLGLKKCILIRRLWGLQSRSAHIAEEKNPFNRELDPGSYTS